MNPDLPGNTECAICIATYQENENLIQLKCSPMHHFHEDCLKKWLVINDNCPICRVKLKTMYAEKKPVWRRRTNRPVRRRNVNVQDIESVETTVTQAEISIENNQAQQEPPKKVEPLEIDTSNP